MAKNMNTMSVEELESRIISIDEQIQERRAEKKMAAEILDQRIIEAESERKFANMSTAEKRAMAQFLSVDGIESEEAVIS